MVPATVWKDPERTNQFVEYLRKNVREYRELEAPEPVDDKLKGKLSDFDKETCVMKPTDVTLKAPPTQAAPAAAETSPETKKRKADTSPPASSTRSASACKSKRTGSG